MIIKTFSRQEIEELIISLLETYPEDVTNSLLDNVLVISISENNETKAKIEHQGWKHLVYLFFDDIDVEIEGYKLFSKEQAKVILDYIKELNPTHVFVNCEAGICRSVGVKVALEKIYNNKDVYNDYPLHNKRVSSILLNVWKENE